MKIDADTLLMDKAEIVRSLKERNKLAGGMQCVEPLAWSGCCYWMTRTAMRDALELLAHIPAPFFVCGRFQAEEYMQRSGPGEGDGDNGERKSNECLEPLLHVVHLV